MFDLISEQLYMFNVSFEFILSLIKMFVSRHYLFGNSGGVLEKSILRKLVAMPLTALNEKTYL